MAGRGAGAGRQSGVAGAGRATKADGGEDGAHEVHADDVVLQVILWSGESPCGGGGGASSQGEAGEGTDGEAREAVGDVSARAGRAEPGECGGPSQSSNECAGRAAYGWGG